MSCRLFALVLTLLSASPATALSPDKLKQINFDQNVGQSISPDLIFRDSDNSPVKLRDCINHKPTLLVLGYYHCPMLCLLVNDGLINALQQLRLSVGIDFNVVDLSIDSRETPALAAAKKNQYLKRYGRREAAKGWHFLTGDESSVATVASEAGFHFVYDRETNEFAHPSGVVVLTPDGRISRYFLGVNIEPRELNSAITAASQGESGSVVNRLVLLCYHYNPISGRYGTIIMSCIRVSGLLTLVTIGGLIFYLARSRRRSLAN
jgi:protein SCO1/2